MGCATSATCGTISGNSHFRGKESKITSSKREVSALCLGSYSWADRLCYWTHWDLSPGPSACEADVIPLHHVPHASFLLQGRIVAASLRNVGYLWHNHW